MNLANTPRVLPTVRILFYGDSSSTNSEPVPPNFKPTGQDHEQGLRGSRFEFGVSILKEVLEASIFPNITVELVNRFWDLESDGSISPQAVRMDQPRRLTAQLLKTFDEVWFFGQHLGQGNDAPGFGMDQHGYRESDLDSQELSALADWMNSGGGVLMLGDHNNEFTDQTVPPVTLLWNLGRAMGASVLRAGKMRVWEGLEGTGYAGIGHIVNTSGDTEDMQYMPNQADTTPQTIYPVFFNPPPFPPHTGSGSGPAGEKGSYHPLFMGVAGKSSPDGVIRVMPDHGHEGVLVTIQPSFDPAEWPQSNNGFQPKPTTVANGIDKGDGTEKPKAIALVSAYDGQSVGVGRIVAHTTWHHFVNVNLYGIQAAADDNWAAICQYYVNLAWWLKPQSGRSNDLSAILKALALTSNLRDLRGAPLRLLGKAAYQQLRDIATPGQIQDMLHTAFEQSIPPSEKHMTLQRRLPSNEYLLGGMVAEQQATLGAEPQNHAGVHHSAHGIAMQGIKRAIRARIEEVESELHALVEIATMTEP